MVRAEAETYASAITCIKIIFLKKQIRVYRIVTPQKVYAQPWKAPIILSNQIRSQLLWAHLHPTPDTFFTVPQL